MKEILFNKDEHKFLIELLKLQNSKKAEKLVKKLQNADKKIKVSSAKNKGRQLQYTVCEMIADKFNVKFDQNDDSGLIQSRPMGQHNEDIILRGNLKEQFPFSIECKNCEKINLSDWIRQAKNNIKENTDWLLIFKKHTLGTKPLVCLDFDTFLKHFK